MSGEALVKRAYDAYAEYLHWQNSQGLPLQRWEDLAPHLKGAFAAGVREVLAELQK